MDSASTIIKIIMLARSIVGDAEGGAHYLSCKHDNFDIGRGRVQISVLVSDKPLWAFEKSISFDLYVYFLWYKLTHVLW